MKKILIVIISSYLFSSCNMEKEIDLDLPTYDSKIVVECYLEPGQPYRLSLLESVSYFEPPALPQVENALVTITYNGVIDTLQFAPMIDPITTKFYNYTSSTIVPFDYSSNFSLYIQDQSGRIVTATTRIIMPVMIDTVQFRYNEDSLAFALTRFFDNASEKNYYRYQVVRDTSLLEQLAGFVFDDELFTTSQIELGSDYEIEKGDSVIVSLYHIDKSYYDFIQSTEAAIDANGNPFGQPASIKSNVNGGIGIFTGLSYDRWHLRVP